MTLHSMHFAQYAHALPLTIRLIIRLAYTSHFHYHANIGKLPMALSLVGLMGYAIGLHTQFSHIGYSVLQSALCFSLRLF